MSIFRKFWIHHPGADNPVGLLRWLAFQISEFMCDWQPRLEEYALYDKPPERDNDIPF